MGNSNHITVKEALEAFYKDQDLDFETTLHNINYYPLGFVSIPFPNLPARKKLLHLHDLNHILMGYDTSLRGEAKLAAVELGSGFPKGSRVGYLYSPFAVIPGLVLCPLKVIKAFFIGRHLKNACHLSMAKDKLLDAKLEDIRRELGLEKVVSI